MPSLQQFRELLASAAIEDLYPRFNWSTDPAESCYQSCVRAACCCVELGSHQDAREALAAFELPEHAVKLEKLHSLLSQLEQENFEGVAGLIRSNPSISSEIGLLLRAMVEHRSRQGADPLLDILRALLPLREDYQPVSRTTGRSTATDASRDQGRLISASAPLFRETIELLTGRRTARLEDGAGTPSSSRYQFLLEANAHAPSIVSVIIPTFNRPYLLPHAVESVVQQGENTEIIVVNDCGEELSPELLERLSRLSPSLTVVRHMENHGLGAARNTGASLARGKWLLMLDDDDELFPGGLQPLLAEARTSDAQFIFGDHLRRYVSTDGAASEREHPFDAEAMTRMALENQIVCGTFLIERAVFQAVRGYREDLPVHEDYHLHLRVMAAARWKHVAANVFIYNCRENAGRMNTEKRLFWFATSGLNHAIYRALHGTSDRLYETQKRIQYGHIARALREGTEPRTACKLVACWLSELMTAQLQEHAAEELRIAREVCPELQLPLG